VSIRELLLGEVGRTYTGFSYSILTEGGVVESGYGGTTEEGGEPVDEGTLFDLASLTKPIVTATLAGQLIAKGSISLRHPLSLLLPEFRVGDKVGITVGTALNHTSGLPAWIPLYKRARNVDEALKVIVQTPLSYPTGTREIYSDLGYITLGRFLEVELGETLDYAAKLHIFDPLGMGETLYRPDPGKFRIVLTERFQWRPWGPGLVHDENCFHLGGVTGHAGLFSNLRDLERYALGLLKRSSVFPREAMDMFQDRSNVKIGGEHSYGWFVKVSHNSTFGSRTSFRTIGHTGFTGTGMWIDLEKGVASILLTNRVYYGRDPSRIQEVRRKFNELAFSLG
jgi:CubicO group peptidase (beta-lactamase class C family)